MSDQIPFVDYLVLGDPPHLVANECTSCGARFFDRRNACASCSGTEFKSAAISTQGELCTFPIGKDDDGVEQCSRWRFRTTSHSVAATPTERGASDG